MYELKKKNGKRRRRKIKIAIIKREKTKIENEKNSWWYRPQHKKRGKKHNENKC